MYLKLRLNIGNSVELYLPELDMQLRINLSEVRISCQPNLECHVKI